MGDRALGTVLVVAGILIAGASGLALVAGASPTGPQTAAVASPTPASPTSAPASTSEAMPTPAPATPTPATPTPTATPTAATPTAGPSVASPDDESVVRAFLAELVVALQVGDGDLQVARLHPATLERYGEAQCREALPQRRDATIAIDVRSVGDPETWDYETDSLSTPIRDAIPIDAEMTAQGSTSRRVLHLAVADGSLRWFTDCGTPVVAQPSP